MLYIEELSIMSTLSNVVPFVGHNYSQIQS